MNFEDDYSYVLRLARGGATRFALSEYLRLGLEKVRNNEDIMALQGRLYKDLFLSKSGKIARDFARVSAEKYEAAFQETKGFYSGINAATMSLVAGVPADMVSMRANRLLEILPSTDSLESEAKYFVEATRAEAYLLLEDEPSACGSLRTAIDHDPLNYVAHAATLKQFQMIAAHRGNNYAYLEAFRPPKTAHFAGHMFGLSGDGGETMPQLTDDQVDALRVQISDLIQAEDIGFWFGALAAGSDILFAEVILEEGGELHINLPVNPEVFVNSSVRIFGESWVTRFENCIAQAASVSIASPESTQLSLSSEKQASLSNMGAAIRKAQSLAVRSVQVLIWDAQAGVSGTAADASLWNETDFDRHIIPYEGRRKTAEAEDRNKQGNPLFTLGSESSAAVDDFDDLAAAISEALTRREDQASKSEQVIWIKGADGEILGAEILPHPMPGSIIVSEPVANYLALSYSNAYAATQCGTSASGQNIYVLH